ncbi:hypothetical protein [Deinococcus roseus]|uniref:DUF1269 domain-containing protein n=1 Tax=Deinococcus roseus TaxID=392414 RepID=A0ABQ2D5Z1_9DEIO|nr:hypothetical protein [Deinococcus roseus]GGJ47287.1 hypothetical protein GCM10008938_36650 [Deinococcus roseus]
MVKTTHMTNVIGVFQDCSPVEHAVQELLQAGFTEHALSFMVHQQPALGFQGEAAPTTASQSIWLGVTTGEVRTFGEYLVTNKFSKRLLGHEHGLRSALQEAGCSEDAATYFASELASGCLLLMVTADSSIQVSRAQHILRKHGGSLFHAQTADQVLSEMREES